MQVSWFSMAKVYPRAPICSLDYMTSKRETFTIWMKPLACHSNGCTVFNWNGEIVCCLENYDKKCSNKGYLMDLRGKVLFTIRRRKSLVYGRWDGYRWSSSSSKKEKPWFQVKKYFGFLVGDLACQVTVLGHDRCRLVRSGRHKAAFRVENVEGDVIAEVNQKQSSSGISLGEDVLTLNVQPRDRSSCDCLWNDQPSNVNNFLSLSITVM